MARRVPILVLAALASCAREPLPAPGLAGRAAGRSVLWIQADSLAAGHLSSWGHGRATSPALDALAARGVRFADASSQTSWTTPSVASCFTGLEQERHGLLFLGERLSDSLPTIAERFAAAGYRTLGIAQTPLLGTPTGLGRGFERWRVLDWDAELARDAADEAARALAELDGPFFLYLHLSPPHMPYAPPAPFRGRFGPGPSDEVDGSIASARRVHRARLAPDHPDVLRLAGLYDDHVAYLDALVGDVLAAAGRRAEPPLVVVSSDHGEAFLEHGSQGHNASVHVEMVHVPLLLWAPDLLPEGLVVDEPVSLLDVAPTLVELCGLAPLGRTDGRSLAPLLEGRAGAERALFLSSRHAGTFEELELGLRRGRWKLVLSGASGRAALYDVARDPGERRDLAGEHRDLAAELERELRAWHAAAGAGRTPRSAPDEATLRAAAELGYLDEPPGSTRPSGSTRR